MNHTESEIAEAMLEKLKQPYKIFPVTAEDAEIIKNIIAGTAPVKIFPSENHVVSPSTLCIITGSNTKISPDLPRRFSRLGNSRLNDDCELIANIAKDGVR